MWVAYLTIKDEINKIQSKVNYPMKTIHKYGNLYLNLSRILKSLGYQNYRYRRNQIEFKFRYLGSDILVDNWNKYILNRDEIEIRIFPMPIEFKLMLPFEKHILFKSLKQKDVYNFYNQFLKGRIKSKILVKVDDFLLDVLDTNENQLNKCIDRLILNRGF